MPISFAKILSLLIAVGNLVAFVVESGGVTPDLATCAAFVMLPLALIWFPEELGSFTGYLGGARSYIDTETPPFLVATMGWLFLVGLPLLMLWLQSPGNR